MILLVACISIETQTEAAQCTSKTPRPRHQSDLPISSNHYMETSTPLQWEKEIRIFILPLETNLTMTCLAVLSLQGNPGWSWDKILAMILHSNSNGQTINLKSSPVDRHKSFKEDDISNKPVVKETKSAPIKATVYSVADLQVATDSFNIDNLVRERSIGHVHKAQLHDVKVLAVTKIYFSTLPGNSDDDFIDVVADIARPVLYFQALGASIIWKRLPKISASLDKNTVCNF